MMKLTLCSSIKLQLIKFIKLGIFILANYIIFMFIFYIPPHLTIDEKIR